MNFETILSELKAGHRVARSGWNGANQFVYMTRFTSECLPCFMLRNAQGKSQPGWVPSIGDLLAEDWGIVYEGYKEC